MGLETKPQTISRYFPGDVGAAEIAGAADTVNLAKPDFVHPGSSIARRWRCVTESIGGCSPERIMFSIGCVLHLLGRCRIDKGTPNYMT